MGGPIQDPYALEELERLFAEQGGRVLEVPRLTREELWVVDGTLALLWLPAGLSRIKRRRVFMAVLYRLQREREACAPACADR